MPISKDLEQNQGIFFAKRMLGDKKIKYFFRKR